MTEERFVDELAVRVFGWRLAPGRYLKPDRSWIPRSKFRPLTDVRDAVRLLDALTDEYVLTGLQGGAFTAEVRLAGQVAKVSGRTKARVLTLAIAKTLGMDLK